MFVCSNWFRWCSHATEHNERFMDGKYQIMYVGNVLLKKKRDLRTPLAFLRGFLMRETQELKDGGTDEGNKKWTSRGMEYCTVWPEGIGRRSQPFFLNPFFASLTMYLE